MNGRPVEKVQIASVNLNRDTGIRWPYWEAIWRDFQRSNLQLSGISNKIKIELALCNCTGERKYSLVSRERG